MSINYLLGLTLFVYLNLIFLYYFMSDIRSRKIPNKGFFFFILIYLVFFCFKIIRKKSLEIQEIIFIKVIYILLSLFISFCLYLLKMIGGGDAKLILIIFIFFSEGFMNLYLFSLYYFLIILTEFLFFVVNFSRNSIRNNSDLIRMVIYYYDISSLLKKLFIHMFLIVLKIEKFNNSTHEIAINSILFNPRVKCFQTLSYYRPPMIIICIVSFYLIFLAISLNISF